MNLSTQEEQKAQKESGIEAEKVSDVSPPQILNGDLHQEENQQNYVVEEPIPDVSKKVADSNIPSHHLSGKEKDQRYLYQIALVRREVKKAQEDYAGFDITKFRKAIKAIGIDQLQGILDDPQERHHRRLCQGRAAASHPAQPRREAYVFLSAVPRFDIEKAIHSLERNPTPFEPSDKALEEQEKYLKKKTRPKSRPHHQSIKSDDPSQPNNLAYQSGESSSESTMAAALREALEKTKND